MDTYYVWVNLTLSVDEHLVEQALVVKAASVGGCARLWSEDLNAGQIYDGVSVENPL